MKLLSISYLSLFIGHLLEILNEFGCLFDFVSLLVLGLKLVDVVLHEGVLLRAELLEDVGEQVLDVFLLMGAGEETGLLLGGVLIRRFFEVKDSVVVLKDVDLLDIVKLSGL